MKPVDQIILPDGIDASEQNSSDDVLSPNALKILGAVQDSIAIKKLLEESQVSISAKLLIISAMQARKKVTKAIVKTFVRQNNSTLSNVAELHLVSTIYDLVVALANAGWQTSDECKSLIRHLKSQGR